MSRFNLNPESKFYLELKRVRTVSELINLRIKRLIQTLPRNKNPHNYMLISKVYADILNRIYKYNQFVDINEHFDLLELCSFVKFDLNSEKLQEYLKKCRNQIDSVDLIRSPNNLHMYSTLKNGIDLDQELLNLKNQFEQDREYLLMLDEFLRTSKGPKIDIFAAHLALELKNGFAWRVDPDRSNPGKETISFDLPEIFSGCYISTKLKKTTSKANSDKITMIALNLVGYQFNERQLKDLLERYKDVPEKFKRQDFVLNIRTFLEWKDFYF